MKGVFIPEITTEMFKNGCLEAIEALMAEGEIYDIEYSRWIPVSERLPEDSGNYLIAIADSNYTNGQYFKISWFYPNDKGWSYRNAAVIAWMPLPEPYKAESEVQE